MMRSTLPPVHSLLCCLLVLRHVFAVAKDSNSNSNSSQEVLVNTNDHPAFADAFTEQLYSQENECSSSLGLSMALDLIYPSATGSTKEQMQSVLGYPATTTTSTSNSIIQPLLWNDTTTRLGSAYQGRCIKWDDDDGSECTSYEPTLQIANSVWVDDSVVLNTTYQDIISDYLHQLDFADSTAPDKVNAWVNQTTNGLVESIVDEEIGHAILLAINSIYFKGSWESQFRTDYSNEDVFYADPLRTTTLNQTAHFMHQVHTFEYSHDVLPGFQVLRLPFAGESNHSSDGLSMIFVLPLSDRNSEAPTSSDILASLAALELTEVAVGIPKFKFELTYQQSIIPALKALGMQAPFEGGFCIEQGHCDGVIDEIIQKTVIDVNEEGAEAAAATAVWVARGRKNAVLFLADHPFQFFIYDSMEDLVIFEGRVGNPGIPDGSTAELQSSHADVFTFWNNFHVYPITPEFILDSMSEPTTEQTTAPTESDESTTIISRRPPTQDTTTALPPHPSLRSFTSAQAANPRLGFSGLGLLLLIFVLISNWY